MTDTTSALSAHIAKLNAEAQAWMDAAEGRWASMLVEDDAHWAELGIHTPAEFDHYMLACDAFEMHKSAWGFKPSWAAFIAMTDEQLRAEMDLCREQIEDNRREREACPCDEDEDLLYDAQYEAWLEELRKQEQWCNPAGELEFVDGIWREPRI